MPLYIHPFSPLPQVHEAYYSGFTPLVSAEFSLSAWGWHNEAGIHVLRLILSGTFEKFPALQVISGHWGEMVPFYLQRLDDVMPPKVTGLSGTISEIYRRHVWVTPSGMFGLPHFEFMTFGQVDWFSTYRVHHRVASRFRVGSVFLAGDAGHVHSPVGGQGMNTGLQDAHNLALLLTDITQGRRDGRSLDCYERERGPLRSDWSRSPIARSASSAGAALRPSLLRNRASGLGGAIFPRIARSRLGSRLGSRVGGYLGQYRIRYHYLDDKAPVPAWANDPAVGLRLPPAGGNHEPLRSMTWQMHTYGAGEVIRPDGPAWIDGPYAFGADPHARLRPDRLYPHPPRRVRGRINPPPRPCCRRSPASLGHCRPQADHLSHQRERRRKYASGNSGFWTTTKLAPAIACSGPALCLRLVPTVICSLSS